MPLGLELVGQYLNVKPDLSLLKMQQRLEDSGLEHKAVKNPTIRATAKKGVKAAFELSWVELSERARKLACLLSLFALAPIPWRLVEQCLPDENEEELEDCRDDELVKLSLLKRTEKQT